MADENKSSKTDLDHEFANFLKMASLFGLKFSDDEKKQLEELKKEAIAPSEKFQNGNAKEREKAKEEFDKIKDKVLEIVLPKFPDSPEAVTDAVNGIYKNLIEKYEMQNAKAREKAAQHKKTGDSPIDALVDIIKNNVTDTNHQEEAKEIAARLKKFESADRNADGQITLEELIKTLPKLDSDAFKDAFRKTGPEGFIKTDEFKRALENATSAVSEATSLPAKAKVAGAVSK